MSFIVLKLLFVPLISVFIMVSSVYLGYQTSIPMMLLTASLLYASVIFDRKFKWLRNIQFLFLGAFHFVSHLNWCILLYYILIINLIHKKERFIESLPLCLLMILQYSIIRLTYVPITKYNILVAVFDCLSSFVIVVSFHFVNFLESEKKKLYKQNDYLTYHDPLTGLLNYDGYLHKVQHLVELNKPFQLVLLDINNFKSLNAKDISTANEILINFSRALRMLFLSDMLAASRYAGDRFAVLLPEHVNIDSSLFNFESIGVQVTYSITCYPHEALTYQEMISTAEDRIFQMRRNSWMRGQEEMIRTEKMKMVGELAAGMAHEIRNPLTSIKGFIQLSKNQGYNIQPWYEVIMGEITRVGELTAEFLHFSKPHASNMRVESLTDCLTRVYSLCESEAASRGHLFRLDLSDEPIQIVMDRDKIIQVLINLIRNSFQAMEHTGTVRLSLRAEERMAVVEVEDTGKGIPDENLVKIFDPFYTTKEEGTGLGLSLCQKIVEDHGGRITVHSELGIGTTFTLRIPLA
ncbi:ATP-binding protein [Paenibacillus lautus]|uniref:ATP-binding protein n=1 Tax=Paenibacillus lautus TaxID=1401 RepID=UPI001C7CABC4|nr:ATP-binding protein [Paenibacillus lautus]MBX4148736.1 diguanylate cyclase [Paenibacillus lautus]